MLQQKTVDHDILRRKQQNALRRQPVTPGAACFLVVVLHALGHVVVDDIPHVGFVDAHAERVGGHNDRRGVVDEIVLALAAFLVGHTRVVARRGNALALQHFLHGIDIFARSAVDNAALAGVAAHIVRHKGVLAAGRLYAVVKVGAVKPGNDDLRVLQAQRFGNVVLDLAGRSSRKGADDGPLGQRVDKIKDAQIAGAEILPPLADAVCFVDRQHRDVRRRGKGLKRGTFEPLRRDVDDLVAALRGQLQRLGDLVFRQRRVDVRRRDARRAQPLDLVLHQRDQRRDDQRQPRQQQRRDLVAKRFPRACGHDGQCVPP